MYANEMGPSGGLRLQGVEKMKVDDFRSTGQSSRENERQVKRSV